ncbi:MAG: DUF3795 domain-containing protein [Angelakisella sp.]|jgi:hypothetical protein|nr:DUF3795 domain-containing protein [Angelakisella sp.]
MGSICGIDCTQCQWHKTCRGCTETGGRPFGGECVAAGWCQGGEASLAEWKEKLMAAFRALGIPALEDLTELFPLRGSFINLEYPLPGGQKVKLWDDSRIYFGNQLHGAGNDRCYGIAADEQYLMVAEYGENGSDAEIVVFKRWN